MQTHPISWLVFFTLAAAILVAAMAFLSFLRSRNNREIAAYTLAGQGEHRGPAVTRGGAATELVGIFAIALIAMGLLAVGYKHRGDAKATTAPSAATIAPGAPPPAPAK